MSKLLVDMSSLLWQSLLAGKDEEFGREVMQGEKKVWVNGWQFGLECSIAHLVGVMRELKIAPVDVIFVVEGQYSKSMRQNIYNEYKVTREKRPPEAYVEFERCRDELCTTFQNLGSQVVTQDGVEGDDMLAYLCSKIEGEIVILTRDGDMTTLIDERISLWQNGGLTKANKYGPFAHRFVPVYKALCGDGEEYKGAKGFGPKSFLDMLVWGGDGALPAMEGLMKRRKLEELEDDVSEFKAFRKVIDCAEHVYQSYDCALLHPEWCDTKRQPMKMIPGKVMGTDVVKDSRLIQWASNAPTDASAEDTGSDWWSKVRVPRSAVVKNHAVYDCELIGIENPVFLVCFKVIETGETGSFWHHVEGDMDKMHAQLQREDLTWISFNGLHFDQPIVSAAICGKSTKVLKELANFLINENGASWNASTMFNYETVKFDHIDLIEVSPGVRVSLKAFAGRMGYPTMIDMPFHHDQDLTPDQYPIVEAYCQNDLGVTEALFNRLRKEIELRVEMSEEHGIDLRSKSDAQVAEAILKKVANIGKNSGSIPATVRYEVPQFIETDSDQINDLIYQMTHTDFVINAANGQVVSPAFLDEPIGLCTGTYQVGVGGLHSTHDKSLHVEATEEMLLSDFDVASYYPNIMIKAGFTPKVSNGARFIEEYTKIYDRRIEAKNSGNKRVADALKISLNGTFGKLGSPYSAFYSPDLLLAVTLTGQLNLMCLIYDLECRPSIRVLSANTDGIMVQYRPQDRDKVLAVVAANAERTGFIYEETRYSKVAMKDVNNYLAITTEGKVKRKGLYAATSLMKNPTMQVCSNMALDYLKDGVLPEVSIENYTDIRDFVAIRNVKSGGIQFDRFEEVDDWICVKDLGTKDNEWRRPDWEDGRVVKRKSRPAPVQVGVGGQFFGRIARWYMQKDGVMPISYAGSGNRVPKTDGARLCMTLPSTLPDDLDRGWYIQEAYDMLADMGVKVANETVSV